MWLKQEHQADGQDPLRSTCQRSLGLLDRLTGDVRVREPLLQRRDQGWGRIDCVHLAALGGQDLGDRHAGATPKVQDRRLSG